MHRFFKYIIAQKKAKYINIRSVLLLNTAFLEKTQPIKRSKNFSYLFSLRIFDLDD